jgi:signal transduction histidine kinase
LVVDDEPVNRQLVRRFIGDRFRLVEAADGDAAMAALKEHAVDLVLLDVMLPGESGFDVCKRIKQLAREDFLPVVMLTALAEQDDRNAGLSAGADDFLTKPVNRVELMLRIDRFLELRQQRRIIAQQFATLRELDALKDDLVTLLVHDLRNPLSGVIGFLHIFEHELKATPLAADASLACKAAEQVKETLDDLLQVQLLEEGRLQPRPQPHAIDELVRDACTSVAGAAALRGVRLEPEAAPGLLWSLDRTLVRRALENLLQNAIRFAPPGSTVQVAARVQRGGLELAVHDRGAGLQQPARADLFLKFGGLHAKRSSDRRGFGLGLYFVRLVAEAHGGGVDATSSPEAGTVMAMRLGSVPTT